MNRLFGTKSTAPKPNLQAAIGGLDTRIETIDVKLAKLNAELQTYQQRMSKMRDGPGKNALRQKALKVLQQRKMYEGQREQLQQQSWNMEQAGMMQDNLKSCSPSSLFKHPIIYTLLLLPPHSSLLLLFSITIIHIFQRLVISPLLACLGAIAVGGGCDGIDDVGDGDVGEGGTISDEDGDNSGKNTKLMPFSSPRSRRRQHGGDDGDENDDLDVMVTVDALKTTNKELKKQYGKIDIDKIEQLQDEMADLMDLGNEIQASISRSYDIPDDVDEAELDAELEALGEEMEWGGIGEDGISTGADTLPAFLQEEVPSFVAEEGAGKEKVEEGKGKVAAG